MYVYEPLLLSILQRLIITLSPFGVTNVNNLLQLCPIHCSYNVLRRSDGIEDLGSVQLHLVLVLLAAWILTFVCLIKGIHSVGKVN
jgi:hypothetical protein